MKAKLDTILKKMCELANAPFDQIDFKNDEYWYMRYCWGEENENQFREWLIDYLNKDKKARELLMYHPSTQEVEIKKVVELFIFNFGFTTNKEMVEKYK